MPDRTFELSRRKALIGLGTVGAASAGAGMGTSAYFSDEESFEGNSLTAGELDLFVHVDYSEDQGSYNEYAIDEIINGNTVGEESDGEPLQIAVDDVKPGDSGWGNLCFSIVDNDAYMWMCGELTANDENGQTEPEAAVDDTGGDPGEGEGELADAIEATLSYCTEAENDGGHDIGDEIISGTLREVLTALQNGVPLDGDGDGEAGVDRAPFEGVEDTDETAETCVCVEWEVPTDVGNEIQTDSIEFDFSFYAEQARHNDGAMNPCITGNVVEGFGKFAYWDDSENFVSPWFGKVRNGGSNTHELEVGNAPGDSDTSDFDYGGSSYDGELTVEYDADSGEASLDFNGSSVSYDVDDDPGDVISVVARGDDASHRAAASNVRVNGSTPSGADAVEADGDEINSLNIESVDTGIDWTLTADVELEGLDDGTSSSDENPAVYVEILDTP